MATAIIIAPAQSAMAVVAESAPFVPMTVAPVAVRPSTIMMPSKVWNLVLIGACFANQSSIVFIPQRADFRAGYMA
jgi:hypothetical protein